MLAAPNGTQRPGNPYLRLLYGGMRPFNVSVDRFSFWRALSGRYQATHIHWPEKLTRSTTKAVLLLKFARLAIALAAQRLRGGRVVWTCHNLTPHEGATPLFQSLFVRCFLTFLTDVIYLTAASRLISFARYPGLRKKRTAVIPHGHYRPIFPSPPDRSSARESLGLPANAFVLLHFGQIRPYKQVPLLIEVFKELDRPDVRLVIAGSPADSELEKELRAQAAGETRILLRLEEVPEAEVPTLFAAADLMVCPFREILNSGSVLLALSLDRPVLAPALGSLPDLQKTVGAAWIRLYHDAFCTNTLARTVDSLLTCPPVNRPDLSPYDWDGISEATYLQYLSDQDRSSRRPNSKAASEERERESDERPDRGKALYNLF